MKTDEAISKSNFDRNENDAYYTEPWCTQALLRHLDVKGKIVWEPAVGRGDMAYELVKAGASVHVSDIDLRYLRYTDKYGSATKGNFLYKSFRPVQPYAIITNPPFGRVGPRFIRHAMSLGPKVLAFLLRSEFNSAATRTDLFQREDFAYEIVLTNRPRWDDWWNGNPPKASPRHNYSWFVWDQSSIGKPPTTFWEGREV